MSVENVRGVLKSPTRAFRDILASKEGLGIPLVIVVISGILGGISSYYQKLGASAEFQKVMEQSGSAAMSPLPGILIQEPTMASEVGRMIILAPLGWVIAGVFFLVVSKLLKGKAGYKDLLVVGGYAQAPMLAGGVLGIGANLALPSLAILPSFLFGLWTLVLTIIGVREANGFSTVRAVIAVILPAVLLGIIVAVITFGAMAALFMGGGMPAAPGGMS
jgi:hypothetical protein